MGTPGGPTCTQPEILFATTFNRFRQADAAARIRILEMPYIPPARHSNWDELRRVFKVLSVARSEKVLLLNSSSGRFHPDTLALAILGLFPKSWRPKVGFLGDMWEPNTGLRNLFEKTVVRLADRAIDLYLVHSSEELAQ